MDKIDGKIKGLIRYQFAITLVVLASLLYFLWLAVFDSGLILSSRAFENTFGYSAFLVLVVTSLLILIIIVLPLSSLRRNQYLVGLMVIFFCLSLTMVFGKKDQVCHFLALPFSIIGVIFIISSSVSFIKEEKVKSWIVIVCILGQLTFFWLTIGLLRFLMNA